MNDPDPDLTPTMESKGLEAEWAKIIRGPNNLQLVKLRLQSSRFLMRSDITGHASQAVRAAEVALPPVIQEIS
jgi:hypothetical protein